MEKDAIIEVERLTKRYPGRTAISDVSFTVRRGEVVGFLGLNGAGKSTTLRILSTFLPASSGSARIAGFDVAQASLEVRRRIGYMPENNPLPPDMRVWDYLAFRSTLKRLTGKRRRERIEQTMEQCGLTGARRRLIGVLSRGYRQRVGLADALLSDPELLMVDEPTVGLDPSQIRSVRDLIRNLAQSRTVLMSSHLLAEVEKSCSRVLILHRGRVLADQPIDHIQDLVGRWATVIVEVAAAPGDLRAVLENDAKISRVEITRMEDGFQRCMVRASGGEDLRIHVAETLRGRGWKLRELTMIRPSLEDVFVHLTGSPAGSRRG